MSVRMALVKLAAAAAGGAVVAGGAVHVAEAPAAQTTYVKHAPKQAPKAKRKKPRRVAVSTPHNRQRKIRRVVTRSVSCVPQPQAQHMAMVSVRLQQLILKGIKLKRIIAQDERSLRRQRGRRGPR